MLYVPRSEFAQAVKMEEAIYSKPELWPIWLRTLLVEKRTQITNRIWFDTKSNVIFANTYDWCKYDVEIDYWIILDWTGTLAVCNEERFNSEYRYNKDAKLYETYNDPHKVRAFNLDCVSGIYLNNRMGMWPKWLRDRYIRRPTPDEYNALKKDCLFHDVEDGKRVLMLHSAYDDPRESITYTVEPGDIIIEFLECERAGDLDRMSELEFRQLYKPEWYPEPRIYMYRD